MTPFSNSNAPEIERELDAGERLLWTGRPNAARWKARGFRWLPLALFLSIFLLLWMWVITTDLREGLQSGQAPSVFSALPFLVFLAPVGALWLRPWLEAARARHTFYALTDQRALIVTAGRKRSMQSVSPAQMQLERRDYSDLEGDLILMKVVKGSGDGESTIETGFFAIPNPREVERLIRSHLKAAD